MNTVFNSGQWTAVAVHDRVPVAEAVKTRLHCLEASISNFGYLAQLHHCTSHLLIRTAFCWHLGVYFWTGIISKTPVLKTTFVQSIKGSLYKSFTVISHDEYIYGDISCYPFANAFLTLIDKNFLNLCSNYNVWS